MVIRGGMYNLHNLQCRTENSEIVDAGEYCIPPNSRRENRPFGVEIDGPGRLLG